MPADSTKQPDETQVGYFKRSSSGGCMKFRCEAYEMPVIRQYPMGIHHDGGTVMNTQLDSACGCGESIILSTEAGTHFVEIPHAIILALATLIEAKDHQSQIENLLRAFIRARPGRRGS